MKRKAGGVDMEDGSWELGVKRKGLPVSGEITGNRKL